jgi:hypothetical protein
VSVSKNAMGFCQEHFTAENDEDDSKNSFIISTKPKSHIEYNSSSLAN